jgi:transposase
LLTKLLLPPNADLDLTGIDVEDQLVTLTVCSTRGQALCPVCAVSSSRAHSSYVRTIADLPCCGRAVKVRLRVRRFFCGNTDCPRRTFAERVPTVAAVRARRTGRLAVAQRGLGLALGGEAGARRAHDLAMGTSPDTLLRLVRQVPTAQGASTVVLGVDDWAWKTGHKYGTILVDLEQHRPIDLLPDRQAETLAAWLRQHPGVRVISRDRAGAYAEGAAQGAPQATQVADRWHLLQNLREALQRLLDRQHRYLPTVSDKRAEAILVTQPRPSVPQVAQSNVYSGAPKLSRAEQVRQERRSRRLARFEEAMALYQQGVSIRTIGRTLQLDRKTVRRYITFGAFPEIARRRPAPSVLDPWKPYLTTRWNAGCHNGMRLFREIREKGYQGSRTLLSAWIARLRHQNVEPVTAESSQELLQVPLLPVAKRQLSARQASWLLVRSPEDLDDEEQAALIHMRQASSDLDRAYVLAQEFGQIIREHRHAALDLWLHKGETSLIPELKSFVAGLRRDHPAVEAALKLGWSNGQVEGQVNRLKFLKRSMYGRANFDLLRQRVLCAA